ncbi:N-formylglutamate amidohydrolase [Pseudonocardia sp. TMWB2A]|uniref:N-formylglutamate amidohydrolase n=1 Tax=Pseudonocardia sp. TMWB2A TaxID=687430 RepID=UPI00307F400E
MSPDTHEAWTLIGTPRTGGILIISDHASNHVPDDIDLGIAPALLDNHIAIDIGVAEVGRLMVEQNPGFAAYQCGISRLVIDCNRDPSAPGLLPHISDGHSIPGNYPTEAHRDARLARFFTPYHARLEQLLAEAPPALIVSLHSFTPDLHEHPETERPWQIACLYNEDDRAARIAIPLLEAAGLVTGDQQPYSGKLLNYTMDRHAEGKFPYLGIEVRQDQIKEAAGQQRYADIIAQIALQCSNKLA